ncbi:hypothetical protein [Streptacidiphilus sp. PAMC 29251]
MNQQSIEHGLRELAELAGPHQVDLNAIGGRIRRRRRTRLAVSATAVVALVAGCGWLLPGLVSDGTAAAPAAPAAPVAPAAPASPAGPATASTQDSFPLPTPSVQASFPMPTPAKLDAETRPVADLLKRVLPPGKVTVMGGQGLHDKGLPTPLGSGLFEPVAWAEYDDGHGVAMVDVDLTRWRSPDATQWPFTCTVGPDVAKPDHCETGRLPGGGVFNLSRIDALPGAWNAEWTATYAAPDGTRVVIQEDNAPGGKPYAPTRIDPPFDAARLQQMVTSPLWDQQLAAIPAAGSQSNKIGTP